MLALNPVLQVRDQVREAMRAHGVEGRAGEALELAGLPASVRILNAYAHQLSGGERQRVLIAQALACRPALVIADEPFTALDLPRIVELAALFQELKRKTGSSFLVISHSPGVLAHIADQVLIMHQGRIVEQGPVARVFGAPAHPYTAALLAAARGGHG
jgi:ABC-type dipeptide/oligopeptide/nickel transport system ATPase component